MTDIRSEGSSRCPHCHNKGLPIMDIEGTLPVLDVAGYPQYYCEACSKTYTASISQSNISPTPEEIAERRNRLAKIEDVRAQRLAAYEADRGYSALMRAYISADMMYRNDTLWFECYGISTTDEDMMYRNDTLWFECYGISTTDEDVHHG